MGKSVFGLDDSTTGVLNQTNSLESRLLSVQRCCEHIVHACQCRDANCRLPSCRKMKRVIQHAKNCKQKYKDGCQICTQFIALCCYHAKHCQEAKCPVPFCVNIKHRMRQPKLQKKLKQAQVLRRHNVTMWNSGMSGAVLQSSSRDSNSFSQPSTSTQTHSSSHSPLQNIQAEVAIQTVPHVVSSKYDKIMGGLDSKPNSIGNSTMGLPQIMPNPGPSIAGISRYSQAWQQLRKALKSPLPTRHHQVLAALKASPQLMAAFIKYRTAQQQKHVEQQHVEQLHPQEQQQQLVERLYLQELQQQYVFDLFDLRTD